MKIVDDVKEMRYLSKEHVGEFVVKNYTGYYCLSFIDSVRNYFSRYSIYKHDLVKYYSSYTESDYVVLEVSGHIAKSRLSNGKFEEKFFQSISEEWVESLCKKVPVKSLDVDRCCRDYLSYLNSKGYDTERLKVEVYKVIGK